ncbi:MAG: MaoC family dehydratase [Burkholderiales bacterium]|nr:MaoC family dehydratase [Burkholderiales bacterium]
MKSAVHAPGFDDFAVGEVYTTYRRTVTEADLVGFIQLSGVRAPIFLDDHWARSESPHGGRIAPGFLTCTVSAGMLESVLGANTIAGLSMDGFRFHAPVRPGDTLGCEVRIDDARPTADGHRGVLTVGVSVKNQHGACVLEYTSRILIARTT